MDNILFLVFTYIVMGLGVWSTSKYKGDGKETPFIAIVCMSLWPILLFVYAVTFIFTGRKFCDE